MKNYFISSVLMFFCALAVCAQGNGVMTIGGKASAFDTLIHRRIGPGMTYTKVYFDNAGTGLGYRMMVNAVAIDMTNPYNSQKSYMDNGKFYSSSYQIREYMRNVGVSNKTPVATMTAGAFIQSNSTDPKYPVWEVGGGLVSDGVLLLNPSGLSFYSDINDKANIGNLSLSVAVESAKGNFGISNINRVRGRSSGVTMFCNNYATSRDVDNSTGSEVLLTLLNASGIGVNGEYRCRVEQLMSGSGHSFSSNQIVLSANGSAEQYLKNFVAGDEVTLRVSCVDAVGQVIDIMQSSTPMSGYAVHDGVAQGSSMESYAQCAIGVSQDGNTVYWFDLEQHDQSNAPIRMFNEYIAYAGAWNAVLMDGGPSAEMTILGEWATINSAGEGTHRTIPCGVMAFSTAPADNTITSVDFHEVKATINRGSQYTPNLYGFNRYGAMINENAESNANVYLTCDPSIGEISADGKSFIATTGKSGYIYAHVTGSNEVGHMWVEVNTLSAIRVEPKNFFTEPGRNVQANVYLLHDGVEEKLSAEDVKWTATNKWTCDVDDEGMLYPDEENYENGEYIGDYAYIIAEYGEFKDTINVIVESSPKEDELSLLDAAEVPSYIYKQLPGIPTSFYARLTYKANYTPMIKIAYTLGGESYEDMLTISGQEASILVPLDYDAVDGYPVVIEGITSSAPIELEALSAFYRGAEPSTPIDPSEQLVSIRVEPKTLFTEVGRGTATTLYAKYGDDHEDVVAPGDIVWTSTDSAVCSVDAEGYLSPDKDSEGKEVLVIAEYGELKDTISVVVENSPSENEIFLSDTVKDIDNINIQLTGIPTSFYVCVDFEKGQTPEVSVIYKKGEESFEDKLEVDGSRASIVVPLDYDDFDSYPVVVERIVSNGVPVELKALSALYRGAEPTIPEIPVDPSEQLVSVRVEPKTLFTEAGRGTTASLYALYGDGNESVVVSGDVAWSSTNSAACSVDAEGRLTPDADSGDEDVLVIGEYGGLKDTISVVVENSPKDDELLLSDIVESLDDINMQLPGIPTSFYVRVGFDEGLSPEISVLYKKGNGSFEKKLEASGSKASVIVPLEYDDIDGYPVVIEKITSSAPVELEALAALYRGAKPTETGILNVGEAAGIKVYRQGDDIRVSLSGVMDESQMECSVWTLKGEKLANNIKLQTGGDSMVICQAHGLKTVLVVIKVANKRYVYKI